MLSRLGSGLLLVLAAFAFPCANAGAQSALQGERVAASFVLALGRTPTAAEMREWTKQDGIPLADLLGRHRQRLQGDSADQQDVVARASRDAFGTAPSEEDRKKVPGGVSYAELMQHHIQWLAEHSVEYEQVVNHAYRLVLDRDAYSIEVDYWKRQPTLSFALLVSCIDDWARRNQPGLTATGGAASISVNSRYLVTVRLSAAVAREASPFAFGRNPAEAGSPAKTVAERRVIAPGANHIASVGGTYFAAAGSANLVPGSPKS